MTILVCGSRDWTDREAIRKQLEPFQQMEVTLIHGDCRGADRLAAEVGKEFGFHVNAFPADWRTYGRSAGPIRNSEMLAYGSDIVFAFHDNLDGSGTQDMLRKAFRAGLPCYLNGEVYLG